MRYAFFSFKALEGITSIHKRLIRLIMFYKEVIDDINNLN